MILQQVKASTTAVKKLLTILGWENGTAQPDRRAAEETVSSFTRAFFVDSELRRSTGRRRCPSAMQLRDSVMWRGPLDAALLLGLTRGKPEPVARLTTRFDGCRVVRALGFLQFQYVER